MSPREGARASARHNRNLQRGGAVEAQPHEGIHSKASPNVPRPDPTTATRSKGLGRFRDMGMGVEKETLSLKAPNYHQTGQSRRATYSELCSFACKTTLS